MASGSLPQSVSIHGTSATDKGQSFAGINLGTINYAGSDNRSGKAHRAAFALLVIANTATLQMRTSKRPSSVTEPSSLPTPSPTARA